jgi:hypothetical protein
MARSDNILNELDFEAEGERSERVMHLMKHRTDLVGAAHRGQRRGRPKDEDSAHARAQYVPSVRWDLTSRHVLTMEFIRGMRVTDTKAMRCGGCSLWAGRRRENGEESACPVFTVAMALRAARRGSVRCPWRGPSLRSSAT